MPVGAIFRNQSRNRTWDRASAAPKRTRSTESIAARRHAVIGLVAGRERACMYDVSADTAFYVTFLSSAVPSGHAPTEGAEIDSNEAECRRLQPRHTHRRDCSEYQTDEVHST